MMTISLRCLLATIALATAPLCAFAVPVVMDFEPGGDFIFDGSPYSQAGYSVAVSTGGSALVDFSTCFPSTEACANGNATSFAQVLNDTTLTLKRDGGGAFALGSFRASFLPSPSLDYSPLAVSPNAIRLHLDGITDSNGTVTQYFDLLPDTLDDFLFSNYTGSGDHGGFVLRRSVGEIKELL